MLMAVLAIEWSLLVHGFLHLHYDICDVDNFSISGDQHSLKQNMSNLQHLEESHLESVHNISSKKDIVDDEQQLETFGEHLNNVTQRQINIKCNPAWPWININLHRWIIMVIF